MLSFIIKNQNIFVAFLILKEYFVYNIFLNQLKHPTMRKLFTLCLIMYIGISCTNPAEKTAEKTTVSDTTKPVYAYTISKPDNWDIGSSKNTAIALNALKAFENNKIDESLSYFADTVFWKADYMEGKYPKDSLKVFFTGAWKDIASVKIDLHDFESVISKDKKDEYVTIWYVQKTIDKKGKADSVVEVNDMKIVNGKITELDETIRHFKVKK